MKCSNFFPLLIFALILCEVSPALVPLPPEATPTPSATLARSLFSSGGTAPDTPTIMARARAAGIPLGTEAERAQFMSDLRDAGLPADRVTEVSGRLSSVFTPISTTAPVASVSTPPGTEPPPGGGGGGGGGNGGGAGEQKTATPAAGTGTGSGTASAAPAKKDSSSSATPAIPTIATPAAIQGLAKVAPVAESGLSPGLVGALAATSAAAPSTAAFDPGLLAGGNKITQAIVAAFSSRFGGPAPAAPAVTGGTNVASATPSSTGTPAASALTGTPSAKAFAPSDRLVGGVSGPANAASPFEYGPAAGSSASVRFLIEGHQAAVIAVGGGQRAPASAPGGRVRVFENNYDSSSASPETTSVRKAGGQATVDSQSDGVPSGGGHRGGQ